MLLVDGSPCKEHPEMASVGAVVCTPQGQVLLWRRTDVPARTSMEAEYQAVISGLEIIGRRYAGITVRCLSDCRMVIDQINGRRAVRAAGLKPLHTRAVELARALGQVEFIAIPRELNELADALAGFRATHERLADWLQQKEG